MRSSRSIQREKSTRYAFIMSLISRIDIEVSIDSSIANVFEESSYLFDFSSSVFAEISLSTDDEPS